MVVSVHPDLDPTNSVDHEEARSKSSILVLLGIVVDIPTVINPNMGITIVVIITIIITISITVSMVANVKRKNM